MWVTEGIERPSYHVGAALLTGPATASAEIQLDVYAGGALTDNADFSFSGMGGSTQGLSVNNTFVFGGRIGYWFDSLPWRGLAVDAFQFSPTIPSQTVNGSFAGVGGRRIGERPGPEVGPGHSSRVL
jgi:hypothetical protein